MPNNWENRATLGITTPAQADRHAQEQAQTENALSAAGDGTVSEANYLSQDPSGPRNPAEQTTPTQSAGNEVPNDPDELRRGYLRQQDYTRKTQETAELRREAEQRMTEAQRILAQSQQTQAQLSSLMAQQGTPRQQVDTGLFTPDELNGIPDVNAREGLRVLNERLTGRMQRTERQMQEQFNARLAETANDLRAREMLRQQNDYVRSNPDVRISDDQWRGVFVEMIRNPHYTMDQAIGAATPNLTYQRGLEAGKRAALAELDQRKQASVLQMQSQVGANSVFKPDETFEESMAAVYGQQPGATPETISQILRR